MRKTTEDIYITLIRRGDFPHFVLPRVGCASLVLIFRVGSSPELLDDAARDCAAVRSAALCCVHLRVCLPESSLTSSPGLLLVVAWFSLLFLWFALVFCVCAYLVLFEEFQSCNYNSDFCITQLN